MVTTGEGTTAVDTVTLVGDSVETVATGVLRGNRKVFADDRAAKDLLKGHAVCAVELELGDHGDRVIGLGVLDVLALEAVERHECDTASLLFGHDVDERLGSLVGVDHDVEQAGTGDSLDRSLVLVRDLKELVQRTIDTIEVESLGNGTHRTQTSVGVLVHHLLQLTRRVVVLVLGVCGRKGKLAVLAPELPARVSPLLVRQLTFSSPACCPDRS